MLDGIRGVDGIANIEGRGDSHGIVDIEIVDNGRDEDASDVDQAAERNSLLDDTCKADESAFALDENIVDGT